MAYGLCRRPLGQAVNRWPEGLRGFANCSLPGAPSQEHSWPSIDLSFQSVEFSCKLSHKSDRLKVWESTVALKLQKGCQPLGTRNVVCLTPLQQKLQFSSQDEKYVGWTLWRWGGANLRISFLWGTFASSHSLEVNSGMRMQTKEMLFAWPLCRKNFSFLLKMKSMWAEPSEDEGVQT